MEEKLKSDIKKIMRYLNTEIYYLEGALYFYKEILEGRKTKKAFPSSFNHLQASILSNLIMTSSRFIEKGKGDDDKQNLKTILHKLYEIKNENNIYLEKSIKEIKNLFKKYKEIGLKDIRDNFFAHNLYNIDLKEVRDETFVSNLIDFSQKIIDAYYNIEMFFYGSATICDYERKKIKNEFSQIINFCSSINNP